MDTWRYFYKLLYELFFQGVGSSLVDISENKGICSKIRSLKIELGLNYSGVSWVLFKSIHQALQSSLLESWIYPLKLIGQSLGFLGLVLYSCNSSFHSETGLSLSGFTTQNFCLRISLNFYFVFVFETNCGFRSIFRGFSAS